MPQVGVGGTCGDAGRRNVPRRSDSRNGHRPAPLTSGRPARGSLAGPTRVLLPRSVSLRPPSKEIAIEARARPSPDRLPRPRLLACDIDGTLLDGDGALRPAVRDAVAAIAGSGVEVVLATGRSPWSGVAELAADLGLRGAQITMQGALLSVPATGAVHRLRALPPDTFRDAIRFADELGLDPVVALLDGHQAERLPEGVELFSSPVVEGSTFEYVSGLEQLADQRPIRIYLPTGPDRHRAVRMSAAMRFAGHASVVWTDLAGIELLAPRTNKGEAVGWLAASRGISLDEVAAVGDAANDTEMLRVAGRSAAMGSAPAEVRVAADVVVPPAGELGILDAFGWFFPDLTGSALRPIRPWTARRTPPKG